LHAVYPSRRGMAPAVKAFVDLLAAELPKSMARAHREFVDIVGGEAASEAMPDAQGEDAGAAIR
jgi:hypothetical protein